MEREARLREKLISQLRRSGALHSERVAAALSRVPRHRFVPASSPEEAYADQAIALKLAAGEVISSVSQPSMLAQMLELLDAEPGDRILEIGTGSGYNAALLAELAGEGGAVTTVELDPELARFARRALAELGYARVRTVLGDGGEPLGEPGAYDRIVVSARCEDVARAWWEALPEGGRLVVPLRLEGAGEFAVGFERRGERLAGVGAHPCAFVALRGSGAAADRHVFYRDPAKAGTAHVRTIVSVQAVRACDATAALLEEAGVVIARPVTIFGVRFA